MDDNTDTLFRIYDTRTNQYWANWRGKKLFNQPGHAINSANKNNLCRNDFTNAPCGFKEQSRYIIREFRLVEA